MSRETFLTIFERLRSTKIKVRADGCEDALNALKSCEGLAFLKTSPSTLETFFEDIKEACNKDAVKKWEDYRKKSSVPSLTTIGDVFALFVQAVTKEQMDFSINSIIDYVIRALTSEVLRFGFGMVLLQVLADYLLSHPSIHGLFEQKHWCKLFTTIKGLVHENVDAEKSSAALDYNTAAMRCFMFIVKYGPLKGLSLDKLHQESHFFGQLICKLNGQTSRLYQEAVLCTIKDFFLHLMMDCRMECCRLSEEISLSLCDLYEANSRQESIKLLIIDLLYVQVSIHRPRSRRLSVPVYYFSATTWQHCIKCIHEILLSEVKVNVATRKPISSMFLQKESHKEIHNLFSDLFADVSSQLLDLHYSETATFQAASNASMGPPAKRKRVEFTLKDLIDYMNDTKSWIWLDLISVFITNYPHLLKIDDYMVLLRLLTGLQPDCKNADLHYHLHKCLLLMESLQLQNDDADLRSEANVLWTTVAQTLLRNIIVHQNDGVCHMLLQTLISKRDGLSAEAILQHYKPTVLSVGERSIETLLCTLRHYSYTQSDRSVKKELLQWLFQTSHEDRIPNLLYQTQMPTCAAELLTWLFMRQWCDKDTSGVHLTFYDNILTNIAYKQNTYLDILDECHACLMLQHLITSTTTNKEQSASFKQPLMHGKLHIDADLHEHIVERILVLWRYCKESNTTTDIKCKLMYLIWSFLQYEVQLLVLTYDQFKDHPLLLTFEEILFSGFSTFAEISQQVNDSNVDDVLRFVEALKRLFGTNSHNDEVTLHLRKMIPTDSIKILFGIAHSEGKRWRNSQLGYVTLKNSALECLILFSCLPFGSPISFNQEKALEALVVCNSVNDPVKLQSLFLFLKCLKLCPTGFFSVELMQQIMTVISMACVKYYQCYFSAVTLVSIIQDFMRHAAALQDNARLLNLSVQMLLIFFEHRHLYGPKLSIGLLKCINLIYVIRPTMVWSENINDPIFYCVPDFLTSEYHEVCLEAVRVLANYFCSTYNILDQSTLNIYNLHEQELFYHKIETKCKSILRSIMESTSTDEDVIGRTSERNDNRVGIILQMLGSIMVANTIWIDEVLYCLMEFVVHQKLGNAKVQQILKLVAKSLHYNSEIDLLKNYVGILVEKWYTYYHDTEIDEIPFWLFGCSTLSQFYCKYVKNLSFLMYRFNLPSLTSTCEKLDKSATAIAKEVLPELMSNLLVTWNEPETQHIWNNITPLFENNTLPEVLRCNIGGIFIQLIGFIHDMEDFRNTFDNRLKGMLDHVMLPKFHVNCFNVGRFYECLGVLANQAGLCSDPNVTYSGKQFMHLLLNQYSDQCQQLLLSLNCSLSSTELLGHKLLYCYYYCFVSRLIIESIPTQVQECQQYFVRHIIYTILHSIRDASCRMRLYFCSFLYKLLSLLLPQHTELLKPYIIIISSTLKNCALENNNNDSIKNKSFTQCCIEILDLLIVEHVLSFAMQIQQLDPFPAHFSRLHNIHSMVKQHSQSTTTLLTELYQFCENFEHIFNDEMGIADSNAGHLLRNLHHSIVNHRNEILSILEANCIVLHKVLSLLFTSARSTCPEVAQQALHCLGEIGPVNLNCVMLKRQETFQMDFDVCTEDKGWTTWELLAGFIIVMCARQVSGRDANVAMAAARGLCAILPTKEGQNVSRTDSDFGNTLINRTILYPFYKSVNKKTSASNYAFDKNIFICTLLRHIDCSSNDNSSNNKTWIQVLTSDILSCFQQKDMFEPIRALCQLKISFCDYLLPILVFGITQSAQNDQSVRNSIVNFINDFFSNHWTTLANNTANQLRSIYVDRSCIQTMLNVVQMIRFREYGRNLPFDFLVMAKGAQYCSAHLTAIMYAELWCEQILESENYSHKYTVSKLDVIYENIDEDKAKMLEDILRGSYNAVGEKDALLGCRSSFLLLELSNRIDHYRDMGNWQHVLHYHDIVMSQHQNIYKHWTDEQSSDTTMRRNLIRSLSECNLHQVSLLCASQLLDEPNFDSMWKLSQWEYTNKTPDKHNLQKCKYLTLKAIHDGDANSYHDNLSKTKLHVLDEIMSDSSLESIQRVYSILSHLQSLKEINGWYAVIKANETQCSNMQNSINRLLEQWSDHKEIIVENTFSYVEPIITQRLVLIKDMLSSDISSLELKERLGDLSLEFAQYARMEGYCDIAYRWLFNLRLIDNLPDDMLCRIQLEEAQICWTMGDQSAAKCILRRLCASSRSKPRLLANSLKLAGQWAVECQSENRQTIIQDYFLQSLEQLKDLDQTIEVHNTIVDTYYQLATFADSEYRQVRHHIKSDAYQRKLANMDRVQLAINKLEKINYSNDDLPNDSKRGGRRTTALTKTTPAIVKPQIIRERTKAYKDYINQKQIDQAEVDAIERERNTFIQFALQYYLYNLTHSDEHNSDIFRVLSLLNENRSNPAIESMITEDLPQIASHKFLCILPQMAPHLSHGDDNDDRFSKAVDEMVRRCAIEHPHHTLPIILALANAHKDEQYMNTDNSGRTSSKVNNTVPHSRTLSVQRLLSQIKKHKFNNRHDGEEIEISSIISKMELLADALIELAYYKPADSKGERKGAVKIPSKLKINKIRNFEEIALPTRILSVEKDSNYNSSNFIGLIRCDDHYFNVGGINAPKKIILFGTDGGAYEILVKGHDDLRQDAVMQQVFTIMNNLLQINKSTKNLNIRTYKIVPLSMRSGILEWVQNTRLIGELLNSAHQKYRPNDWTPLRCLNRFREVGVATQIEKFRTYTDICKRFKPVLHKYFIDKYPLPSEWYENRQAYIRSVAASSMCGYILGIGDRHVSNILIDESTVEVVHIDFGVAFEQGQLLNVPETVPFRLTRDIVDGMGVAGVEGVFRKCCEKSMQVLRQHSYTILAILEVLLYDPLYQWTISSEEAKKRQANEISGSNDMHLNSDEFQIGATNATQLFPDTIDVNVTADRALLRLQAKLQGTENQGKPTSIETQVANIIQEAMNPANLCRLYYGWQPYY